MGYGMDSHLAIGFQTSGGTSSVASLEYLPILNESLTLGIGLIESETLKGRFDEGDFYHGAHTVGGDISLEFHPILMGKLLKAVCNHSSGTLVGSVWTHKFSPSQVDWDAKYALPPMTGVVYRGTGSAMLYSDLVVSDLSFEIAQGELLKATASVVGGGFSQVAAGTATYVQGSSFTWDQISLSLGGAGVTDIMNLTVKISQAIEPKSTINGSRYATYFKRGGMRSVEVNGTILFNDQAEYQKFVNFTSQRFTLYATGQTLTTSQSAGFGIDIPKMIYTEYAPTANGVGQIEVSFTGKGKYHVDSATMIEFTLVNTRAAY